MPPFAPEFARRDPLIPRMFYRRLALLGGLIVAALALPVAQLTRLTVAQGDELRSEAESRLQSRKWHATTRGRILDRKGLVLAADRPAYDLAVDYPVITGQWAFTQAAARAKRENRGRWNELTSGQRQAEVDRFLPEYQQVLEAGWAQFCQLAEVTRAEIEDRKHAIVAEVSRQAATVVERERREREAELNRGRELSEQIEVSTAQVQRPIREQRSAHVILHNVPDEVAFRFPLAVGERTRAGGGGGGPLLLPGVQLLDASGREYPFDTYEVLLDRRGFPSPLRSETPLPVTVHGVAVHLVGWMRDKVYKEDLDRRPVRRVEPGTGVVIDRGGYMPTDSVGHWGIEASGEDDLRGQRGQSLEHLDTGEVEIEPSVAGKDVTLTIDARLQARVQALFSREAGLTVVHPWQKNHAASDGEHLSAAAVVIDIASGDILAMVSTPTFTREDLATNPGSVFSDTARLPLLNRAVARPYPPGSIVKPLMYVSACAMGLWQAGQVVDCTGHLYPHEPGKLRCWIFKAPFNTTHTAQLGHVLNASDALMVSCNIYYYTIGRTLGPERILDVYKAWGVGKDALHPRLGLGDYFAGVAGPPVRTPPREAAELSGSAEADDAEGRPLPDAGQEAAATAPPPRPRVDLGEATLMGIGQGPIAWTPLHAADAYATLARGGKRIVPRIRADEPVVTDDLRLPPQAVAMALDGLWRAANETLGTGHHITVGSEFGGTGEQEPIFNCPGTRVWGKSGTADSGLKARDSVGNIRREVDGRAVSIDHSWFVILTAPEGQSPRYAVALVVENGGSGGRVAGPLCNQIVWALKAQGYLE